MLGFGLGVKYRDSTEAEGVIGVRHKASRKKYDHTFFTEIILFWRPNKYSRVRTNRQWSRVAETF